MVDAAPAGRGFRAVAFLALVGLLITPATLRADDDNTSKSKLRFRPPGSKSSSQEAGDSRIRWGDEQRKATAAKSGAPAKATDAKHTTAQGLIAPPHAKQSLATQASGETSKATEASRDAEVITAGYTRPQDRYADRYADDEAPQRVADHISNDDFFGGPTYQDNEALPPPRFFATQDDGAAPAQQPIPASPSQQPGGAKCPTKEELGMTALTDIVLDLRPGDTVPESCPLIIDPWYGRNWECVDFFWKASAICHKPLYFEDVSLERYGHSHGMFAQPFVSGAHFFAAIPLLPYKMGVHHPTECIYPLGYYRPGSCAPKLMYPMPLSWRGALYQGAASTGLVFLIP